MTIQQKARQIAVRVSEIAEKIQKTQEITEVTKDDKTSVTIVDLALQAYINKEIKAEFPSHNIIAEESDISKYDHDVIKKAHEIFCQGKDICNLEDFIAAINIPKLNKVSAEYTWIIDPIDGTQKFLEGDCYAHSIAVMTRENEVVYGIVVLHQLQKIMKHLPDAPLLIDAGQSVEACIVKQGELEHYDVETINNKIMLIPENRQELKAMQQFINKEREVRVVPVYCTAKAALVGVGLAQEYIHISRGEGWRMKIWDVAAPAHIVSVAGSHVSDMKGEDLVWPQGAHMDQNPSGLLIASNKKRAEEIIEGLGA